MATAAPGGSCPGPPAAQLHRAASYQIALDLPPGASAAYKDDPYESAEFFDLPMGRVEISSGMAPVLWWAREVRELCRVKIDGYVATLYRWTALQGEEIGAWFDAAPPGKHVLVSVPTGAIQDDGVAIAELLSLRFINDARRLRLVAVDAESTRPVAAFVNELGVRRQVSIGDVVTAHEGHVLRIERDAVAVKESLGPAVAKYRLFTYRPGVDAAPEMLIMRDEASK